MRTSRNRVRYTDSKGRIARIKKLTTLVREVMVLSVGENILCGSIQSFFNSGKVIVARRISKTPDDMD